MYDKNLNQIYWQVFKNLEQDFIKVADVIHVDDNQQEVYSMKIADLLIRTVIEIEALAKELYLSNGGARVADEEMYFDTVCMNYLDDLWNLESKIVLVVSPYIYFENDENKILKPLHKAKKRGSSSADWNRAYQAVKHNRVKELRKGNIKHFLRGLAALFLLNLYYQDLQIRDLNSIEKTKVNPSFGSDLFAVKIHKIGGLGQDGKYEKAAHYDECVYIEDHEENSKNAAIEALSDMNNYLNEKGKEKLDRLIIEKEEKGEAITAEWINEIRPEIMKGLFPIEDRELYKRFSTGLHNLHYNVVLNKKQY